MEGGNFNSVPNRGESQEFLNDDERKRRLGDTIAELITRQSMVESLQRRNFVGDSQKSQKAMARNESQIASENAKIAELRQQAINLGGTEEVAEIDRKAAAKAAEAAAARPAEEPKPQTIETPTPQTAETSKSEAKPAELPQPDYEAILEWNERETTAVAARDEAVDRDREEALAAAQQVTQDEINSMLANRYKPDESLTPEEALKNLSADIEHLNSEITQLENTTYFDQASEDRRQRYLAEARADLASMQRRHQILEGYHENGDALPIPASEQAAGGDLGDLVPDQDAEDFAKAQRVVDWAEAAYLHDAAQGSDTALRGLYFKERGELVAQGMTKEQADAAIMEAHSLSAEDLQRLSAGIETADDEARVITMGEEALAAGRKAAEEARKLATYSEGSERIGEIKSELADELDALNEELSQAIAERGQLAEGDPKIAELDQKIQELSEKIKALKDRKQIEIAGTDSGRTDLGTGVGKFNTIDYEYSQFENNGETREQKKQSIWEKLKGNGGFGKVFRSVSTRAAAIVLGILMVTGMAARSGETYAAEASGETEPTTSTTETGGAVERRNIVIDGQEFETGGEVNLTQAQLEAMFGESVRNINDITSLGKEYMELQGYQWLENGVFYNDSDYKDFEHKTSKVAFTTDHTEVWENKDEEEAANAIYQEAHANLGALAAYACSVPEILRYCGVDTNTKAPAFYQMLVKGANGAELQEKALSALKSILESKNTTIEFGTISGKYSTDYISTPSSETPAERTIEYNTAKRNEAKAFFVNYQAEGSDHVTSMVITATCMQTNVFLNSPITTPSGKPADVPVDENIPTTTEETPTEEGPTDETTTTTEETPTEETPTDTTTTQEVPTEETPPERPTTPGTPTTPNTPETPKTPETPNTPDENKDVKVKNAESVIENANIGGTDTVTERGDRLGTEDRTTEESATPAEGNQTQVENNMVVDSTTTVEEQEVAHVAQEEANNRAEEIANQGPMSNETFENLMDYFNSVTNDNNGNNVTTQSTETTNNGGEVDQGNGNYQG